MTTKQKIFLFFTLIVISSCNKTDTDQSTSIDVSKQWLIDPAGLIISSPADGQWQTKTFTSQELSLFNSLDTANLTGTTMPGSVFETPPNYTYPNPFTPSHHLSLRFANGFSGQIVFKGVIVDSLMTPHFKVAARLNVTASPLAPNVSATTIAFYPTVPIGRFRFYYTLSSQSNQHFYKSWGNIQKKP